MVKNLFSKFRKKKVVNLSNEEKVKALSDKANDLLDHMQKTHAQLGNINEELVQVIASEELSMEKEIEIHRATIKRYTENRNKAIDEIAMNAKVRNELEKFMR